MKQMPTNVIRLWELDDDRAPARVVGTVELDDDGMGSFVQLSNNYTEHEPIDADPVTLYPPHTVESVDIKLIGAASTRFEFDTSRTYGLELWTATRGAQDTVDRWAYLVIPAMRRQVEHKPWRVIVPFAGGGKPATREVDEIMTHDEHGAFVPVVGTVPESVDNCYPAVCFYTDLAGHQWGHGPTPTAYSDSGEPVYLPEPLGPATTHVLTLTDMSPTAALEYTKETNDA